MNKPLKPSHLFATLSRVVRAPSSEASLTPDAGAPRYDAGMAARHPLRILVAEGNPVNQKVAIRMLQRLGYRADLAANGLEVLDAFVRQPYDVVLMDIQMPEMDGVAAMHALRGRVSAETQPHIIALTAHAIKGAAATIGATELAEAARALEALARSDELGAAAPAIERLKAEWERVERLGRA